MIITIYDGGYTGADTEFIRYIYKGKNT